MRYILFTLCFCLTEISHAQKTNYEALINEGNELLHHTRYPLAEETFKKALSLDTNRVEAYYGLGRTYLEFYKTGEIKGADCILYLNKALIKDSSYEHPYPLLAFCKGKMHDFNGALVDYDNAIRRSPDSSNYFGRAMIKVKLNNMDGACADFQEAIKLGSTIARKVVTNRLIGITCDSIKPLTPREILMKSYFEIKDKKSVSYDVTFRTTTSTDKYQHSVHAKAFILKRIPGEPDDMPYFWISTADTSYFFYDMSSVYVVNSSGKTATVFEVPFFFNSNMMTRNGVMLTELIWSSFFVPTKSKNKAEDPTLTIEPKFDTVINGRSCYQMLLKYPDDAQVSEHSLLMCFNKEDYMPVFFASKMKHGGVYQYSEFNMTDYVFDKVDVSKFSKSQIPESYKIETYKSEH